ncbi:MAG: IPT/TIG domain-containing protein [Cyclobacteriaceae bacterium]
MMNSKYFKNKISFLLMLLVVGGIMTACNDDEDNASDEIVLLSYGPSPILRGDEMKFIGRNLDQVTSIVFPDEVEVTDFVSKESGKIVLVVPEAAVPGDIIIKTPQGDIVPKTPFDVLEPIEIESISPLELRPGATLTITGTYLNLIKQVEFSLGKVVAQDDFVSQSQTELKVVVPADAQTGPVVLSNLAEIEEELRELETEEEIAIILPSITSMSPLPVKPGNNLTITGTDLDLTAQVSFSGGASVAEFESVSATELVLVVPDNAEEGLIKVVAPSTISNDSPDELTIVAPAISDISPSPIKAGNTITITGSDLDLVKTSVFGGGVEGTIISQAETQLEVTVPMNASEDIVTLNTVAKSTVSVNVLELIDPVVNSINPASVETNADITINGVDLDLISKVIFPDGSEGQFVSQSETELMVTVPLTATSGKLYFMTVNSFEFESTSELDVQPADLPIINSIPAIAAVGDKITIEGEKMQFATEVIFGGGVSATKFGLKSETFLEVYVPSTAEDGAIMLKTDLGLSTESSPVNIINPESYGALIYDDAVVGNWGDWGWGGATVWSSDEQAFIGSSAAKKTYDGSWDAIRWHHNSSNIDVSGYTNFVFLVYGGAGSGGKFVQLVVDEQWGTPYAFDVAEGKWTEVIIPIADINGGSSTSAWTDILFQGEGGGGSFEVYFDHIGFK